MIIRFTVGRRGGERISTEKHARGLKSVSDAQNLYTAQSNCSSGHFCCSNNCDQNYEN